MSYNQRNVREWTNRVQDAITDELLTPQAVVDMCMSYMSEADVEDMCRENDLKEFLLTVQGRK